jgi:hypothetical protein
MLELWYSRSTTTRGPRVGTSRVPVMKPLRPGRRGWNSQCRSFGTSSTVLLPTCPNLRASATVVGEQTTPIVRVASPSSSSDTGQRRCDRHDIYRGVPVTQRCCFLSLEHKGCGRLSSIPGRQAELTRGRNHLAQKEHQSSVGQARRAFLPELDSIPAARHFARDTLKDWGMPPDDVVLVVCEWLRTPFSMLGVTSRSHSHSTRRATPCWSR